MSGIGAPIEISEAACTRFDILRVASGQTTRVNGHHGERRQPAAARVVKERERPTIPRKYRAPIASTGAMGTR
jgi:hypothetical protein